MEFRFYIDPDSGEPHIHEHGISEDEVKQVMRGPGEDIPARNNSRMKVGQTSAGRYLQVIYVPDEGQDSAFIVTAYELKGKAKTAFRRRRKRKPR